MRRAQTVQLVFVDPAIHSGDFDFDCGDPSQERWGYWCKRCSSWFGGQNPTTGVRFLFSFHTKRDAQDSGVMAPKWPECCGDGCIVRRGDTWLIAEGAYTNRMSP